MPETARAIHTTRRPDRIETGPRFSEADAVRLNRLFTGADTSDMLAGVLTARGIDPGAVRTVVMTHLHSDHLSALPQLPGVTEVWVHEDELDTPYARRQKGILDAVSLQVMTGAAGEIRPGLTWIHTPGHAPGHVAVIAECEAERVVIAGDTLGPDPAWFDDMNPPDGLEERDAHLAAFTAIRALAPAVVVPGHNPPFLLP